MNMEQTNGIVSAMLQTVVGQSGQPKPGKTGNDDPSDFQKLLDDAAQAKDPLLEDRPKTETAATTKKPEKVPAQKKEDALTRIKQMLEQGYVVTQPDFPCVDLDGNVLQPGEYVVVWTEDGAETIPITGLEPWEQLQLQQLLDDNGQTIVLNDPVVDRLLEETAPQAQQPLVQPDAEQTALEGQTVQTVPVEQDLEVQRDAPQSQATAQELQPQQEEGDSDAQVEILDVEQAPQPIFRDVEAAPVKVGEVYDAQPSEGTDVAAQIDAKLSQALEQGESIVRVQLTPESLGDVTVEISKSADGILRVALTASSSETRSILERHAGDLQGMLSVRGQQEVQVDVQRQQESQQSQDQNQGQNQQRGYDGQNGHGQDAQEQRRSRRDGASSQDFMQQLRLGLIPMDTGL